MSADRKDKAMNHTNEPPFTASGEVIGDMQTCGTLPASRRRQPEARIAPGSGSSPEQREPPSARALSRIFIDRYRQRLTYGKGINDE